MYGILNSAVNTGLDSELVATFMTPLNIKSNVPGFSLDTVSLKRKASRSDNQRWELEAAIQPTNDSAAFFVHNVVNGFDRVIYVRMPQIYLISNGNAGISKRTPVGAPVGAKPILTVDGNYVAGIDVVDIDGLGAFNMALGEFIQFFGDPKVYVVTNPGDKGKGVGIYPSLRKAKVDNTQVLYGDAVTLRAYYDNSNAFGIKYQDGVMTDPGTFTLIEAL